MVLRSPSLALKKECASILEQARVRDHEIFNSHNKKTCKRFDYVLKQGNEPIAYVPRKLQFKFQMTS